MTSENPPDLKRYVECSDSEKEQLRAYVSACHDRFWSYRSSKESMAWAGLGLFLAASGAALISGEWPPAFFANYPVGVMIAYTILFLVVLLFVGFQLRAKRWAAYRAAGCDWLMAEWLPGSPKAMEKSELNKNREPPIWIVILNILWPLKSAVTAIKPGLHVYPPELEEAWVRAQHRETKALYLERVIYIGLWLAYAAVILRSYALL